MKRFTLFLLPILFVSLAACGPDASTSDSADEQAHQANPIAYGEDYDDYCDKLITDKRYGALLITSDGSRHTFSSAECMIGYELEQELTEEDIEQRWVVDVVRNKRLLDVKEARFLHSKNQPSPGGLDLSAFVDDDGLSYNMRFLLHGDDLNWTEAVELVRSSWFTPSES